MQKRSNEPATVAVIASSFLIQGYAEAAEIGSNALQSISR